MAYKVTAGKQINELLQNILLTKKKIHADWARFGFVFIGAFGYVR